ncbi:hypothetical protein GPAL_1791 [Glaciecola pallidula DSM 14239 = ACAM 615]|uniref:Uncharacterized protein n=1 Tax=Brumicola pallidula DSM 14239 = ACAM 615 TaxID=1121922 RepID=K6ZID4_9ALTE|nr:hypothetical protein GPAL_1791 [Glaciecola pallidula DSM 14239 = ACAM 615]
MALLERLGERRKQLKKRLSKHRALLTRALLTRALLTTAHCVKCALLLNQ